MQGGTAERNSPQQGGQEVAPSKAAAAAAALSVSLLLCPAVGPRGHTLAMPRRGLSFTVRAANAVTTHSLPAPHTL